MADLINREELLNNKLWRTLTNPFDHLKAKLIIQAARKEDALPIVRCKDCACSVKHAYVKGIYLCRHPHWSRFCFGDGYVTAHLYHGLKGDDFCSYGKKRGTDHEAN